MKPRQWMQIAAVASAVGLTGSAIAHDMDRTSPSGDNASATANSAAQLGGSAANPTPGALPDNGMNNSSDSTSTLNNDTDNASTLNNDAGSTLDNGAAGTTQGSTMASPRSDTSANGPTGGARFGSGSDATSISGSDRLGNTNSGNFNTWMSDYASQHNGRITRQEFLDQMGNRWDTLDTQRRGLTPYEIQETFVFTPAENAAAARTGSDVQPDDMGPGNVRGK